MRMRKGCLFILFGFLGLTVSGQSSTSYDVEFSRICRIDSIAPDTVVQFWRFTQSNNPGEYNVDRTFDLNGTYTPTGTILPCCSCLTEIAFLSPTSTTEEKVRWAGLKLKHRLWGAVSLLILFLIIRMDYKSNA